MNRPSLTTIGGSPQPPRSLRLKLSVALGCLVWLGLSQLPAQASVMVNLDATSSPIGDYPVWRNTGAVAGDFNCGPLATPQITLIDGVRGVQFVSGTTVAMDGTHYEGPAVPDSIAGNGARTFEAWIFDPVPQAEKNVIAIGRRGGPNGSNCTFNHGNNATYGAVGQWGTYDVGWGYSTNVVTNTAGVKVTNAVQNLAFKRWTYIAYTYNPATTNVSVYMDGVLANSVREPGPLITTNLDNVGGALIFRIQRQNGANGLPDTTGIGEIVIAKIRVHDQALDATAIKNQFDAEKKQFGLVDTDGDGLPDWYEVRYSTFLSPTDPTDAAKDFDKDGSTNLQEYQLGTDPMNPDTDGDGLKDGVETNTRVWKSATDTGTDPMNPDTDGDGLKDGVETNTGKFIDATNTGSNPLKVDTDGDTWDDYAETLSGTDPSDKISYPKVGNYVQEITKSAPKLWYRFEETNPGQPAKNLGWAIEFQGIYGPGIVTTNLNRKSVVPALGSAIEFTGPAADKTSTKYVDLVGSALPPDPYDPSTYLSDLTNWRNAAGAAMTNKTTTVEYWIKSTQKGNNANTWQCPAILARESPGDGDMYWGWINSSGVFGFSTSDLKECNAPTTKNVTDGQWHHIVMIKQWIAGAACPSTLYIDGGTNESGGITLNATTTAGTASFQDIDGPVRFLGVNPNGEQANCQFIGFLDEVAIYDRALTAAEVRLHYHAVAYGDTDSDGMPDTFEFNYGLDPSDPTDATKDKDNDGLTNLKEYQIGTDPTNPDTDGDGLKDGVETNTRIWVSASNTGTDPLKADTDGDGLKDGVETNTGKFVSATNTGTNPLIKDSDGDGYTDADEIALGTDPNDPKSVPSIPKDWVTAVQVDKPLYWWRFEGTKTADGVTNQGSIQGFNGTFGPGILDADLGKTSAVAGLGKALEFTGPAAGGGGTVAASRPQTTKYVDFGAPIPELVNRRVNWPTNAEDGKATTVEYWFKSSVRGTYGDNNWQSPAILAHESPGDGDMYWGVINANGDFRFSTSDLKDCTAPGYADGKWHHAVMSKIWYTNAPCVSRMFIDGGASLGGITILTNTAIGTTSFQDDDSFIQYLGFVQTGEYDNLQYIGLVDEVAIYNKAFLEANARVHYLASGAYVSLTPTSYKITSVSVNKTNGVPSFAWETTSGTTYTVQRTVGLSATNTWTDIGQISATGATASFTDTNRPSGATALYYRIKR
jgi:hypothetical protein